MLQIIMMLVLICSNPIGQLAFGEPTNYTMTVMTTDFQFAPNTWKMPSGKKVTLTITNAGEQEHEWVLLKRGTNVTVPFGEDDEDNVYWEIEAGPNETKRETFVTPLKPGTYNIVCGKPQHIERGMKATLIVE